ncbi:uncharacterized protein LOC101896684 [Musca domestica]|uniref:Uncharacterized protein LOC101896684 n=1 Tax=Musca domestica TaxID=7370 RepID=A0A1I8M327_MUSDO|nr:uncharacterized protein LOC101896684 [Musca domestica]
MGRTSNSEIWNYFENIVKDGIAECKICSTRMRNNRVFNLRQHLRKVHKMDIEVQDVSNNSQVSASSPKPYDEEQINAVLKLAKRKMQEERLGEKRYKRRAYIEVNKKLVVRSVIGLVVEDGIGPNIMDSSNMLNLVKPLCNAIYGQELKTFTMDTSRVERNIDMLASNMRTDFSKDLHWRLLSLKIDTDIDAPPKTFCLSTQFIDEGQVETRILGIIKLNEDEVNFSQKHIQPILNKFDIDNSQIVSITWDHTKENFSRSVRNSEYLKEIELLQNYPDINIGSIQVQPYIGTIAHICFMDIFKNPQIFQLFLECRNFAKYLNDESNGYYKIFEDQNLRVPQIDSPWRWGSTYNMMNDLYMARNVLQNVKFEQVSSPEDQFKVNDNLWAFIEAYCDILKYLQKSLLRYYKEEQHIGDFYAQWLKCKLLNQKLMKNHSNTESFIGLIAQELMNSIEARTKTLLENDRFTGCLYLDPRFQHTLNLPQKTMAVEYLKKLWSHAKLYNPQMTKPKSEDNESTQLQDQQQFDDDEDEFLNEFLCKGIKVKDVTTADVHKHLERLKLPFQMVDTNILFFWREWKFSEPELHYLSSICFSIPATQIYNKINYCHIPFNWAGSTNLSADTLNFIRLNSHLLDSAFARVDTFSEDDACSNMSDDMQLENDDETHNLAEEYLAD